MVNAATESKCLLLRVCAGLSFFTEFCTETEQEKCRTRHHLLLESHTAVRCRLTAASEFRYGPGASKHWRRGSSSL